VLEQRLHRWCRRRDRLAYCGADAYDGARNIAAVQHLFGRIVHVPSLAKITLIVSAERD